MDTTALERQNRRLERLKSQGITRSTVLVHQDCKEALEAFRRHLIDPEMGQELTALLQNLQINKSPTNVAKVRHLSLFRYPGGKTWLVPEVRKWLLSSKKKPSIFVEPFAGGAISGLTVAAENLAKSVFLCELDDDVSAVWKTIFDGSDDDITWLSSQITNFVVNLENVQEILAEVPDSTKAIAFKTIIKNRMQRGGIMAAGAGLVKAGESGKGLHSRWYPKTLATRIEVLRSLRKRINFKQGDAFEAMLPFVDDSNAYFFIDPPYTAGGKNAGSRLYTHSIIDHAGLFKFMASVKGSVMLTYDDSIEVRSLANQHGFRIEPVPMKNTHHQIIKELIILKP